MAYEQLTWMPSGDGRSGSVATFVQAPPQSVSPAGQVVVHMLFTHALPVGHTMPQPPQLALSVVVLAHC